MSPLLAISHWGPSAWLFLHAVSFTIDVSNQAASRAFFESLPYVLPCKTVCQAHLLKLYEQYPIDVSSARKCSEWVVKLHNGVNLDNGKPMWEYLDVVRAFVPSSMFSSIELTPEEIAYVTAEQKEVDVENKDSGFCFWPWIVVGALVLVLICVVVVLCAKKNKKVRYD